VKKSTEECRFAFDLYTCILNGTESLEKFWDFYLGNLEQHFFQEYKVKADGVVDPAFLYYTNPVSDLEEATRLGCSFQLIYPFPLNSCPNQTCNYNPT